MAESSGDVLPASLTLVDSGDTLFLSVSYSEKLGRENENRLYMQENGIRNEDLISMYYGTLYMVKHIIRGEHYVS